MPPLDAPFARRIVVAAIALRDHALEVLQRQSIEGEVDHVAALVRCEPQVGQPRPSIAGRLAASEEARLPLDIAPRIGAQLRVVTPAGAADRLADHRTEGLRVSLVPGSDGLLSGSRHTPMVESAHVPSEIAMSLAPAVDQLQTTVQAIEREVGKVMVGQQEVIRGVVISLLVVRGHVLLEGVPGLGKTLLVRVLAEVLDLGFSRVQFTPDLMP